MATLTTLIPTFSFPHELDTLEFATEDVAEEFEVKINVDGVAILVANLAFGGNSTVSLCDLAKLIATRINDATADVDIYINDLVQGSCTCIPCRCKMDMTAEDFYRGHFLTRLNGYKNTAENAVEMLSFFSDGAFVVKATAHFIGEDYTMETVEKVLLQDNILNQICDFSFKVKDIAALRPDATLCDFTISVGERKQKYIFESWKPSAQLLSFVNAFGQRETLMLTSVDTKVNAEIKTARINGNEVNYDSKQKKIYTGHIDYLPDTMVDVAADMLVSPYLATLPQNVVMRVRDGEVSYNNEDISIASLKVNYSESAALPAYQPTRRIRTFDLTFDKTFE